MAREEIQCGGGNTADRPGSVSMGNQRRYRNRKQLTGFGGISKTSSGQKDAPQAEGEGRTPED